MRLSEDLIEKIKMENDIVDVISEDVRLKKSGSNYFGLCPFHKEKTPSFSVSQEKQIYKCFGCGETGNVITYVMKRRNLEFIEAVKFLAERVNIIIDTEGSKNTDKLDKYYKINVDAAKYFFKALRNNKDAYSYFTNRGILGKTINNFGLGYSYDKWTGLLDFLKAKGYKEQEIVSAGLAIKKENKLYDRFRNRVMFPVFDYRGRVIGFGGRVLDDSKPKYLNSPETEVFKKGTNLYALNFAVPHIKDRRIIIVEGYMDVIALHQYGVNNAVASLGTALTHNQAKLLKRYADKIIISYDADLAGQNATLRGLQILREVGFDIKVLKVPQGKDPDEYIRANGKDAFLKLIDAALSLIDYRLIRAKEGFNLNATEDKIKYAKNVTSILVDLDPVEKDIYIKKIASDIKISEQAIIDIINEEKNSKEAKNDEVNIDSKFGQKLYLEPAHITAERSLLKLMLLEDKAYNYFTENNLKDILITESHRKIYDLITEAKDKKNTNSYIESRCDDIESSKEWVQILELNIVYEENEIEGLITDYIRRIKKYKLEESKKSIMNEITNLLLEGKSCQAQMLTKELEQIRKELMSI
ncbi:MAG: DNA primase [Bacillota bacterium]|nr:DNA primase [Bacillota bacterium]